MISEEQWVDNGVDIWEIASNYEKLQGKYLNKKLFSNYLSCFKPEIIEITSQIISENNLAGFKINNINPAQKICHSIKRTFKDFLNQSKNKKVKLPSCSSELIFFIEYENHYKQYNKLREELNLKKIEHSVIFLNPESFDKHNKEVAHAFNINQWFSRKSLINAIYKILIINFKISSNHEVTKFSGGPSKKIKAELINLNSKCLLNKYLIEHALINLLNNKAKTAIFFKSEGYKIRSIVEVCKKANIETIAIQHGLIKTNIKYTDLPINTYFVWSDIFAKELEFSKAKCSTLTVGCPDYDQHFKTIIHNYSPREIKSVRLLFLPNSGKSQTPESEIIFALKLCLGYISEHYESSLTVKAHPGGDESLLKGLIKDYKKSHVLLLDKHDNINYENYDIVVTMNSTIGIESAIYRKPLLLILSSIEMLMVPEYIEYGIAEFVDSYSNMIHSINKIVDNYTNYQKNCDNFINNYLAYPGKSTNRIIEKISQTLDVNS